MLYLTTCVGFGYGLMEGLFPGTLQAAQINPIRSVRLTKSVTTSWSRNVRLVPIDYAFPPRLRGRLTLRRLTLRRNPWSFGDSVFHTVCRYSCQHSHYRYLQNTSRYSFTDLQYAPLPLLRARNFGERLEPRYIFAAETLDQ